VIVKMNAVSDGFKKVANIFSLRRLV